MKPYLLVIFSLLNGNLFGQELVIQNSSDTQVNVFINILDSGNCEVNREGYLLSVKAGEQSVVQNPEEGKWIPALGVDDNSKNSPVLIGKSKCGYANRFTAYNGKLDIEYHGNTLLIMNSPSP